jgi:hypothetical protein
MAFYQEPIADKIVDASTTNGGILSKEDNDNFGWVGASHQRMMVLTTDIKLIEEINFNGIP